MTDATIIAEWKVSRHEHVRVSIEQFKGVDLINIRKWFEAEDGSLRPGKAGIALNVKHLPQLADAMVKALARPRERGLVLPDASDTAASGGEIEAP